MAHMKLHVSSGRVSPFPRSNFQVTGFVPGIVRVFVNFRVQDLLFSCLGGAHHLEYVFGLSKQQCRDHDNHIGRHEQQVNLCPGQGITIVPLPKVPPPPRLRTLKRPS